MHMPPPVHGAAVVGQQIHDSQLIRDNFECAYINASTSTALDNVGHFSLKKISRTLSFYGQVLKTVRNKQPDLVYFTPSTSGFAFYRDCITIRMLRRHKQNIILHLHNKPKESFLHKWYNQWLWRKFFNGTSAIFLGKALADQFSRFTFYCKQVYICPNGMPDKISYTPVRQERSTEPFTFLFLSNMIETKGVYILLEACALLKSKGYSFCCNFVGQWFDVTKDAFEAKCEQLQVTDCVHALGAMYGTDKDACLQKADALVFPTFYNAECFPLVIIEAMQYALPVITTSEGAIADIVEDGQSGWIVDKKNPDALAEKMEWMIKHPKDSLHMGMNGRKRFEKNFTSEHFERKLHNILIDALYD